MQVMPLHLISCMMLGKRCPFAAPRKPVALGASPNAARPSAERAVGGVDPQKRVKAPQDGFAAPTVVGTDRDCVKDGKVLLGGQRPGGVCFSHGLRPPTEGFSGPLLTHSHRWGSNAMCGLVLLLQLWQAVKANFLFFNRKIYPTFSLV